MLKLGWGTVNLEARAAGSPFNWSFTGTATPEQEAMPVPQIRVTVLLSLRPVAKIVRVHHPVWPLHTE